MYIVLAGDDEVAIRIGEGLMHRHEVVFVFTGEGAPPARLERLDLQLVVGSVTSRAVLDQAGVSKCDFFVAATNYDEQNIVACLSSQRLGANRTIAFITHAGFFVGGDDDLAHTLGIDHVVRPAEQLAEEIVRIVTTPGALDVQQFLGGRLSLLKAEVEEGSRLAEAPLRELSQLGDVVLVLGHRGDQIFIPRGDTHFQSHDRVTVIGKWGSVSRFRSRFLRNQRSGKERHRAAIVGCGEVGMTVIEELEAAGWSVTAVESDRDRCNRVTEIMSRSSSMVIHGDGSDLELLEDEGIENYPVLVAVTNSDEKNLLISLLAKHMGVERILTRADNLNNERLFERVGIDVVLSAKGAAVRSVLREIEGSHDQVAELEHGYVHLVEVELPADFPPTRLSELRAPMFVVVGAIIRKGRIIVPKGKTEMRPRDLLLVFTTSDDHPACRNFFLDPHSYNEVRE